MNIKTIEKRLEFLEARNSCPKVFLNIEHELDEKIEQYKVEHPYENLVVINISEAKPSI